MCSIYEQCIFQFLYYNQWQAWRYVHRFHVRNVAAGCLDFRWTNQPVGPDTTGSAQMMIKKRATVLGSAQVSFVQWRNSDWLERVNNGRWPLHCCTSRCLVACGCSANNSCTQLGPDSWCYPFRASERKYVVSNHDCKSATSNVLGMYINIRLTS